MTKIQNIAVGGSMICYANGSRSEQMRRIGLAAANMNNLACICNQACLSLATNLRMYITLIVPILLYTSETWTLNKIDLDCLHAFHMRC